MVVVVERKRESSGTKRDVMFNLSLFRRRKVRETKRREDAISQKKGSKREYDA